MNIFIIHKNLIKESSINLSTFTLYDKELLLELNYKKPGAVLKWWEGAVSCSSRSFASPPPPLI